MTPRYKIDSIAIRADLVNPDGVACESCVFWDGESVREAMRTIDPNPFQGVCRRYPPKKSPTGAAIPLTMRFEWCGEFQAKETA